MSTLTLPPLTLNRPVAPARRSSKARVVRKAIPQQLTAAKMQEVEDRILAAAVSHHPNSDRALDRLLDDIESLPLDHEMRQITPLRRHHQLERMEELLMQAVVQSHPQRPDAMARLLCDVVADAGFDDHDELSAEALIDNDPDGLS